MKGCNGVLQQNSDIMKTGLRDLNNGMREMGNGMRDLANEVGNMQNRMGMMNDILSKDRERVCNETETICQGPSISHIQDVNKDIRYLGVEVSTNAPHTHPSPSVTGCTTTDSRSRTTYNRDGSCSRLGTVCPGK